MKEANRIAELSNAETKIETRSVQGSSTDAMSSVCGWCILDRSERINVVHKNIVAMARLPQCFTHGL